MKILHICPTYANPTCGIGKYTKYFVEALTQIPGIENFIYTGDGFQIAESIYKISPDIVHVQLEYGFFSYERLQIISELCRKLDIKYVITYHTLGIAKHNLVDAIRICHLHEVVSKNYGDFKYLPSGIPKIIPDKDYELNFVPNGKWDFLLFGQIHSHKGIKEVIYRLPEDKTLLIIGSKPVQGDTSFYDECFEEAMKHSNITWISNYLSDEQVLKASTYCHNALFPYTEYGAIGVSAAVRLILNNTDINVMVSNSDHLRLSTNVVYRLSLEEMLSEKLYKLDKNSHTQKLKQEFLEENSFQEVAKKYLKLVS